MVSRTAHNSEPGGPEPRVSSGNANLDTMLYGGFVARRPYLLVGPGGTGKTKLALGFLCEGVRRGENVLLVTLEEPPNEIRINHRGLSPLLDGVYVFDAIPDVMRYERAPFKDIATVRHAVPFSEVAYEIRKTPELTSVEVTFTALEQTLKMEIARRNYTRLVIDSLTALQYFCMKGVDETGGAQTFLRFLSDLRVTTVLTVESPIEETETAERLLARGEVRLSRWEVDDQTVRVIGIEKFRGSAHDIRRHPYRIGPAGLDIDLETTVAREPAGAGAARAEEAKELARTRPSSTLPDVVALIAAVRDLVEAGVDVTSAQSEIDKATAATEAGRTAAATRHLRRARGIISQLALDWDTGRGGPGLPAAPAPTTAATPGPVASPSRPLVPVRAPRLPAWLQETAPPPVAPASASPDGRVRSPSDPAAPSDRPAPPVESPPTPSPPATLPPRSWLLPPVARRASGTRPPLPVAPAPPPGLLALPPTVPSSAAPLARPIAVRPSSATGPPLPGPTPPVAEPVGPSGMASDRPSIPPGPVGADRVPSAPPRPDATPSEEPAEPTRAGRRRRRRGASARRAPAENPPEADGVVAARTLIEAPVGPATADPVEVGARPVGAEDVLTASPASAPSSPSPSLPPEAADAASAGHGTPAEAPPPDPPASPDPSAPDAQGVGRPPTPAGVAMPPSSPAPIAPIVGADPPEAGSTLPPDASAAEPETALAVGPKDPASAARSRDPAGAQGVSPTEESG